jgi:hypothetical protein
MVKASEKLWKILLIGLSAIIGCLSFLFVTVWNHGMRLSVIETTLANRPPRWLVEKVEELERLERKLEKN